MRKILDQRQLTEKEQDERRVKLFKLNQELYELTKIHYFESQAQTKECLWNEFNEEKRCPK